MRRAGPARIAGWPLQRALRSLFAPSTAPVWILALVALLGILLFISLGGLAPAPDRARHLGAREEVRTALYAVSVLSAELTDEVEEQYITAEPDEDLLVLTLRLENLTSRPAGVLNSADGVTSRLVGVGESLLELSGVSAGDDVRAWRTGTSASPILQPGVPATVQVAWPVPEGSFSDGRATLDVYDARERAGQIIVASTSITWRRAEHAAQISVEVSG